MTLRGDRHNDVRDADTPGQPEVDADARVITDTNLVLGCAASIALLTVLALIAYLWTL